MKPYIHTVQYYETDRMQITHHSNYVRWMEEARVSFLDQLNCSYTDLENMGIISPVVAINCKYLQSTTFADKISIIVNIKKFNGIKLVLVYKMLNLETEKIVCTGESSHCFTNKNGKILNMKTLKPDFYLRLNSASN
ncbi:acyl-CoA thioesterase [Ligilactobacillus sp. WILCCON 0076]|uniref:Acyl-CoA thioesterase n=1 Tax=Ligilactobacillus ubinensis TaxID=2876789 RepID=A0A9X2FGJ8_9LACO|nr:acyl-CoA thioesterase [Ligilactobacillus ubinensis]MCP0885997.1 acyl-CoA thioesterase [Ligilactobacillus ubinensis]